MSTEGESGNLHSSLVQSIVPACCRKRTSIVTPEKMITSSLVTQTILSLANFFIFLPGEIYKPVYSTVIMAYCRPFEIGSSTYVIITILLCVTNGEIHSSEKVLGLSCQRYNSFKPD